jgi:hypothetical protein
VNSSSFGRNGGFLRTYPGGTENFSIFLAGFPESWGPRIALAMKRGKSVDFTGYWQRHIAE